MSSPASSSSSGKRKAEDEPAAAAAAAAATAAVSLLLVPGAEVEAAMTLWFEDESDERPWMNANIVDAVGDHRVSLNTFYASAANLKLDDMSPHMRLMLLVFVVQEAASVAMIKPATEVDYHAGVNTAYVQRALMQRADERSPLPAWRLDAFAARNNMTTQCVDMLAATRAPLDAAMQEYVAQRKARTARMWLPRSLDAEAAFDRASADLDAADLAHTRTEAEVAAIRAEFERVIAVQKAREDRQLDVWRQLAVAKARVFLERVVGDDILQICACVGVVASIQGVLNGVAPVHYAAVRAEHIAYWQEGARALFGDLLARCPRSLLSRLRFDELMRINAAADGFDVEEEPVVVWLRSMPRIYSLRVAVGLDADRVAGFRAPWDTMVQQSGDASNAVALLAQGERLYADARLSIGRMLSPYLPYAGGGAGDKRARMAGKGAVRGNTPAAAAAFIADHEHAVQVATGLLAKLGVARRP